jgi:hypothetical protein
MPHILDNIFLSSCADFTNYLGMNNCNQNAVVVGDNLENTVPLVIFYIMGKYGQTYEAARNFVLSKLDLSAIPSERITQENGNDGILGIIWIPKQHAFRNFT